MANVTMVLIHNINANVEQTYKSDSVRIILDEDTNLVKVTCVDTDGVDLVGVAPIVNKTLGSLASATAYYEKVINQLYQGDVIHEF